MIVNLTNFFNNCYVCERGEVHTIIGGIWGKHVCSSSSVDSDINVYGFLMIIQLGNPVSLPLFHSMQPFMVKFDRKKVGSLSRNVNDFLSDIKASEPDRTSSNSELVQIQNIAFQKQFVCDSHVEYWRTSISITLNLIFSTGKIHTHP